MKKLLKKILLLTTISLLSTSLVAMAYPTGYVYKDVNLSIPIYGQKDDLTCWAASGAMVVSHYMGDYLDREEDIIHQSYDAPHAGAQDCSDTIKGIKHFIPNTPALFWGQSQGILSGTEISYQLSSRGPVITHHVLSKYNGQSGYHEMVIKDIFSSGNIIDFIDPLPKGSGSFHTQVLSDFKYSWDGSVVYTER